MTLPRTIAVTGLGLIGGSLARDLAARGCRVIAADRSAQAVRAAVDSGVAREALSPTLDNLATAELVVLAVPVTAAAALLARYRDHLAPGAVVTDVGSTKASIVRAADGLGLGERFVGSHPLAGSHHSGWEASRAGLFAGARVFLTPTPHTSPATLERVTHLWTELGALAETVPAEVHDWRLAWSSHLPQAAASVLARALAEAGVPRAELGTGGRDTVRLAGSSPEMWTAICLDNAAALDAALVGLEDGLRELRTALQARDAAALLRFFAAGEAWSEQV